MTKKNEVRKLEKVETPEALVVEQSEFLTAILATNNIDKLNALSQKTLGLSGENIKNDNSLCNDLVQAFKGFTAKNYDTKMRALFLENNLFFRAKKVNGKSVVRDDALKLERTAQSIVSTIKRYITKKEQVITETTKWNHIKEFLKPAETKVSDIRKTQNERVKNMSDTLLTDVLALWDKDQKTKADLLLVEKAENQKIDDDFLNAKLLREMEEASKKESKLTQKSKPRRSKAKA